VRIGFDASKIMPPRDGIGTYVASLIRALVAPSAADGHELHLFATLHNVALQVLEELLDGRPDHVLLADTPVPRPGAVDLFHATTWMRPPTFDGPLLMTCYDLTVLSHPHTHQLANRAHCLDGLLDALLAGDHFLTLSAHTTRELRKYLEVPAAHIHTVPAAVDARFRPMAPAAADTALARLGIAPPYVLAVGTRQPRKNLGRLFEAWCRLPTPMREATPLVVVGAKGWCGAWDGEAERARLETTAGVRVLGYVADELLPALYSQASVFVYPSLAEGFGFPVLEAMACGAPVITSALSSLPEVAGDAARLVDPQSIDALSQALAEVLGDDDETERLRQASRARAQRFSWQRTAREMLTLYTSLVASDRPRACAEERQ